MLTVVLRVYPKVSVLHSSHKSQVSYSELWTMGKIYWTVSRSFSDGFGSTAVLHVDKILVVYVHKSSVGKTVTPKALGNLLQLFVWCARFVFGHSKTLNKSIDTGSKKYDGDVSCRSGFHVFALEIVPCTKTKRQHHYCTNNLVSFCFIHAYTLTRTATSPQINYQHHIIILWTMPDSNRLPHPCHGCALPGELMAH